MPGRTFKFPMSCRTGLQNGVGIAFGPCRTWTSSVALTSSCIYIYIDLLYGPKTGKNRLPVPVTTLSGMAGISFCCSRAPCCSRRHPVRATVERETSLDVFPVLATNKKRNRSQAGTKLGTQPVLQDSRFCSGSVWNPHWEVS